MGSVYFYTFEIFVQIFSYTSALVSEELLQVIAYAPMLTCVAMVKLGS